MPPTDNKQFKDLERDKWFWVHRPNIHSWGDVMVATAWWWWWWSLKSWDRSWETCWRTKLTFNEVDQFSSRPDSWQDNFKGYFITVPWITLKVLIILCGRWRRRSLWSRECNGRMGRVFARQRRNVGFPPTGPSDPPGPQPLIIVVIITCSWAWGHLASLCCCQDILLQHVCLSLDQID